jgi:predicted PurR-regulated permease PerM
MLLDPNGRLPWIVSGVTGRTPVAFSSEVGRRRAMGGLAETEMHEVQRPSGNDTARQAFIATAVALAVIVGALALWKLRVVLALLLIGFTLAAAMRPGIDRLARWRVHRPVGLLLHYVTVIALLAVFVWFVAPTLTDQVQNALDATRSAHAGGGGLKEKALNALARKLHHLSSPDRFVHPALTVGEQALKALVGVLFTAAIAGYWIFERDRTVDLVAGLLPRPKRKTLRDAWTLVDQKLGAFVRGEILLVLFVSTLAGVAFFFVGEPYWLLLGICTGFLEIVPVVGPLAAMVLAVGAGLTVSWHTALAAGIALLIIRLVEDYAVTPRVLGGAVGLPPLLTLVSVSATGILFGSFYVLLSIPLASVVATVFDVAVRGVDPAEVEVPTVVFPAQDTRG